MPFAIYGEWDVNLALENLYTGRNIGYQGYLWNKLFLSSIIKKHNIQFTPGIAYNEDRLFVLQYLLCCKKIYISNKLCYIYRSNEDGTMGALTKMDDMNVDKYMTEFVAYNLMKEILKTNRKDAYYLS